MASQEHEEGKTFPAEFLVKIVLSIVILGVIIAIIYGGFDTIKTFTRPLIDALNRLFGAHA